MPIPQQGLQGAVSLEGRAQTQITISASATASVALNNGVYDVWCSIDCYLKVGLVPNDVAVSTGYLLRAGNTVPLFVDQDRKIGAIASSTATLCFHQVA
mgnify:CR=1 FL=1